MQVLFSHYGTLSIFDSSSQSASHELSPASVKTSKTRQLLIFLNRTLICIFSIAFQDAFRNVGWSIVKVSVMMVGEFEYVTSFIDSIGSNNDRTGNPLNPFPEIAVTFIFLFLLLMSIILMNLLVGNFTLILKHFIAYFFIYLFIYLSATSV